MFKSGSESGQKRVKYNVQSCGRHLNFRMKNGFRNLEKSRKHEFSVSRDTSDN